MTNQLETRPRERQVRAARREQTLSGFGLGLLSAMAAGLVVALVSGFASDREWPEQTGPLVGLVVLVVLTARAAGVGSREGVSAGRATAAVGGALLFVVGVALLIGAALASFDPI